MTCPDVRLKGNTQAMAPPDCILTCGYCNHEWSQWLSVTSSEPICVICKDKNIKIKEKDNVKSNPFGYDLNEAIPDAWIGKYRK